MLFLAAYLSLAGLVVACGRLKKRGKPNLAWILSCSVVFDSGTVKACCLVGPVPTLTWQGMSSGPWWNPRY
jgi:hypothetical protein